MQKLGSWIWQIYNHWSGAFTQRIDGLNRYLSDVVWSERGAACLGRQVLQNKKATRAQARKSLRLLFAGLRIGCFDPIAKASELPDHSGSALLLGLFGDGWAPFFVTDSLV